MNLLKNLWKYISLNIIGKINWNYIVGIFNHGKYWKLSADDWIKLVNFVQKHNFIILIRRRTHLTTYLISLANFIKTGKFGYWSHALMNLEGENPAIDEHDFIEATGKGVHYSKFSEVFDCDSVCLLVPKGFTAEEWTECIDKLRTELGKPYDTLFDLSEDKKLSCVELVRISLQSIPNYKTEFASFEKMINKVNNLTPQMIYDCPDFVKILEIRN